MSTGGAIQATLTALPHTKNGKKYTVVVRRSGKKCTKSFGLHPYEDYTMHKDDSRKASYIARHRSRENHGKSGVCTAGFWSRWLLWNKPTISGSKKDITRRFGITFSRAKTPNQRSKRRKTPKKSKRRKSPSKRSRRG